MTFKVDVSTHPAEVDKFVRLTTDIGIVIVPMPEWTWVLEDLFEGVFGGFCTLFGAVIGLMWVKHVIVAW